MNLSRTRGRWGAICCVIWKKELIDNLRDRRSLRAVLMNLLLTPVMVSMLLVVASRVSTGETERSVSLPVIGGERAPGLIEYLGRSNLTLKGPVEAPEEAIRALTHAIILEIPEGYSEDFQNGKPAPVRLYYDDSQGAARTDVRRVKDVLRQYSLQVGRLRLMVRGIDPSVTEALAVESTNLATPLARAWALLAMIPLMLIVAILSAGLYTATDTMAGERERGSLEPLLIAPITPAELVVGKLASVVTFSVSGLILSVVGTALALNLTPVDLPGVRVELAPLKAVQSVLFLLPLVLLLNTLQMLLGSRAASFKEAQSSMTVLFMVGMVPSMVEAFVPLRPPLLAMALPVFSQSHLVGKLLRGDSIEPLAVVVSVLGTLLASALVLAITIRAFDRERVVFQARQ